MTPKERFKKLKKKYSYDAKAAEEKIKFIETHCRHVEGDLYGQPLILPEVFKEEILRPIFGLKKKNGKRLIRYAYIQTPKKNAKTTMMAAVELALLFNDGEPSAQIYNCAGDDDQAGLLFTAAKKMIDLDPVLRGASKTFQGSVEYGHSYIRKITSKSDTKHGFNSHGVLYDELHVAKNADLHDNLQTSMAQRSNPLMISISTPGTDKMTICYNRYETAQKILSGLIDDDSFWAVIYESKPDADIYSPKTWAEANPLYHYSENLRDTISIEANRVLNDVSLENTFRRLRLGQWTSSETKWIKTERWTSLGGKIRIEDFEGEPCWLGCDRSSTQDLSSLCILFEDGDTLIPFWKLWIPEDSADDAEKNFGIPYSQWEKEGWITIVEGNTIGSKEVKREILKIRDINPIVIMAYDEWNTRDLAVELEDDHGIKTIIERQGYGLSIGLKKIKELILNKNKALMMHNGNPVVNWTLDNVFVKENDELNIKIVKPKDYKKIDPWISCAMAVKNWINERPVESVYKTRGVITLD